MKKKGFTLIELIAVIAILAVLAVVAVPRVMVYVDRSKKVAVQTEATTIYTTAEAAYNDGKFTTATKNNKGVAIKGVALKGEHFENIYVKDVANFLKEEGLLNNVNMDKFKNFPRMTLKNLKSIMNADVNTLDVDSQGILQKVPGIN